MNEDSHLVSGLVQHPCLARVLLSQPMLHVGREKTKILDNLPDTFLLVDDGELIERAAKLPQLHKPKDKSPHITFFDVSKDSFDPLSGMNYLKARELVSILDAAFPEGENTLTKKTSNFQILSALLQKQKSLGRLIPNDKDHADAFQKIQTLLLSPVLNRVLTTPTNIRFDGVLLVRLNRAELGDFDCFVLANLLVSQYKGHVVIPDFGFYGAKHHVSLIRQGRLTAGVNYLDESPLRSHLLLIKDKIASECLPEDAGVLATYQNLLPGTNEYNDFVRGAIEWTSNK